MQNIFKGFVSMTEWAFSQLSYWWGYVNWVHVSSLICVHVIGLGSLFYLPLDPKTFLLACLYGNMTTGLGLVAGYHRLWCHRSYRACRPLQYFLAILGAGAAQGPIILWVRHHRAHHRYLDTYRDPYNARRGLWWSHIGWLLTHDDRKHWGPVDMQDAKNDPVVQWQLKYYQILVVLICLGVPTAVAYLGWGDWQGGLGIAGFFRCTVSWHVVYAVNSLAHWTGSQPYSDRNTSRQILLMALYTLGEGYHNFHHSFPSDYRSGPQWYDLDACKWIIAAWEKLGLASHLNRASSHYIEKARLRQAWNNLNAKDGDNGRQRVPLPTLDWSEYVAKTQQGHELTVIAGIVYTIGEFLDKHPGGQKHLREAIGQDATASFHGGVCNHSTHAHSILETMMVATVRGGGQIAKGD
ncbi:hypothetical protein BDV26DRAFT_279513 [Aspergillus bertholletiae]|uniref:Acyl-CoA desaturase n=1 Tax=Aspergillus bertholletiae TaxID=1226010 RepID=A0A5N7BF77_9EURO|nr:hypothetical protein BDV26DRAFT_279513 [Aspergillus bertholletiae]